MKQKPSSRRRRSSAKSVLRLPDLEHAKVAVLNSLNSADAKRGYRHAIDEFVDWYCSEPRAMASSIFCNLRYCARSPGSWQTPRIEQGSESSFRPLRSENQLHSELQLARPGRKIGPPYFEC